MIVVCRTLAVCMAVFLAPDVAFASKCSFALELVNTSSSERETRVHLQWGGTNEAYELDYPSNDYIDNGYVATVKLKAHGTEVVDLFYFCGYPGDPEKFWINYRVPPNADFASIPIERGTRTVRAEVK